MRRFVFGFMTGIATTILVIVGSLAAVGHALRVEDPLAPADAIVSVSGDAGPRVRTAVALWRQGYAPVIVFSGAARDPESVSSAEIMKREAMRLGVPGERILLEEGSSTTQQNAEKVAELLPSVGLRSAILVTSPYHQRRAAMHFEREFESAGPSCATTQRTIRAGTRHCGGSPSRRARSPSSSSRSSPSRRSTAACSVRLRASPDLSRAPRRKALVRKRAHRVRPTARPLCR